MKKISLIEGKKFVTHAKKSCYDENEKSGFKLYHKVRDYCHYTENIEKLLIVFVI